MRDHATQPAHFIYHDKFSTSSYFLPALFFRSEQIFATNEVHGTLTPILSTKLAPQSGSSVAKSGELVEAVAAGQADLAAVWDGTKNDVANQTATRVRFIQLPTVIPNDLLVCSAWLDQNSQEKIREAIRSTQSNNAGHIQAADFQPTGDFQWWEDITDAPEAREALATLRRLAAEHPAPVTVNVQAASDSGVAPTIKYLEAAKQAIRLSGTELVLFDSDFHKHPDVTWTFKPIHDGAVVLTSKIEDFDLEPQSFQISFTTVPVANGDTDYSDLTKRIGALIHSRMHRIRYIWPYEEGSPTVIRNVEFSIPKGVPLQVQKITWLDPERNDFQQSEGFVAAVTDSDFFKFQLENSRFPKKSAGTELDFDPMSNIAYRVILERPSDERPIFFALTAAFVALLVFAAVGLVLDVHRKTTVAPALEFPAEQLFRQSFLTGVDAYHEGRTREIVEADVLWCDRPAVEQYINELNTRGLPTSFDGKIVERDTRSFWASLPFLKDIVGGKVERERVREWTADPSRVGDPERLNKLIPFLVKSHLLSPFVGDPGEFDALDKVVHRVFKPFDQTRGGGNGDTLLRWENPLLLSVVSRHLQEVLAYAEKQPSFFRQTWNVEERGDQYLLTQRRVLPAGLQIDDKGRVVREWVLEFSLPRNQALRTVFAPGPLDAWLLGIISQRVFGNQAQDLCLHFRTIAVLRA